MIHSFIILCVVPCFVSGGTAEFTFRGQSLQIVTAPCPLLFPKGLTCLWTPTENCVTWVRSLEALHKVIDKGDCTLAWNTFTHLQLETLDKRNQQSLNHPTCDFKGVRLIGVDVDLPRSYLIFAIEGNSPQVAHSLNGPQLPIGLSVALGHAWKRFQK